LAVAVERSSSELNHHGGLGGGGHVFYHQRTASGLPIYEEQRKRCQILPPDVLLAQDFEVKQTPKSPVSPRLLSPQIDALFGDGGAALGHFNHPHGQRTLLACNVRDVSGIVREKLVVNCDLLAKLRPYSQPSTTFIHFCTNLTRV
jgi:hypothetical protein